jgi:hypothetical protein
VALIIKKAENSDFVCIIDTQLGSFQVMEVVMAVCSCQYDKLNRKLIAIGNNQP